MRFSFTDDQRMLRDTVRGLLARECPPQAVRSAWESGSGRAPGAYAQLAEVGVPAMLLGEDAGGMGMSELELVLPVEEAGYVALPDPLLETALVALPLLAALGGPIAEQWIPRLASGEAVAAVSFDAAAPVAHALTADVVLLARGDALYAAPRDALRLTEERSVDRARRLATIAYEPDPAQRVASGEAAAAAIALAFDRAALGASATLLGLGKKMIELSVEYAKDRVQFGVPIGAQQAVKHRLANALIELEFARPLVYRAAWSLATGAPHASVHVSAAKLATSEAVWFVAKQALQVHGAIGYTIEHDLHMWMKRAWSLSAAYGDVALHRARVGDAILADDADPALVEGLA